MNLGIECRDPNLHFVEQVALRPPEVVVDVAQQQVNEQEIAKAMAVPLPVLFVLLLYWLASIRQLLLANRVMSVS